MHHLCPWRKYPMYVTIQACNSPIQVGTKMRTYMYHKKQSRSSRTVALKNKWDNQWFPEWEERYQRSQLTCNFYFRWPMGNDKTRRRPGVSTKRVRLSGASRDANGCKIRPSHRVVLGSKALAQNASESSLRRKARLLGKMCSILGWYNTC